MTLRDITRQAVLAAIAEYDQVGQEAFLSRYSFDRARLYVLVHHGKSYDSKAIVGAAHGYLPGEPPLAAGKFSGGEATVGRLLRKLGFTVQVGEELIGSPLEMSFQARAAEYQRLCFGADVFWQDRDSRWAIRTSSVPIRSDDARRAVLLRSEGRCENPGCTGDIRDVTDTGAPILEVDHVRDLALGGEDDPAQMIALCPNCHSIKTRGSTREQLRTVLFSTAELRHERLARADMEA
jgi:5-methylcytosine-specific restriction endonuclease McrA